MLSDINEWWLLEAIRTWVKSCPSQQFKFYGIVTVWTVHGCSQAAGAALRKWCRRDCPKMATISSLFLQGKLLRIQRWQPTNLDPGAWQKHLEWGMEPSTSTHMTADRPPTSVTWHVYLLSDPCWGEGTSPLLQTCHTVAKEIRIKKIYRNQKSSSFSSFEGRAILGSAQGTVGQSQQRSVNWDVLFSARVEGGSSPGPPVVLRSLHDYTRDMVQSKCKVLSFIIGSTGHCRPKHHTLGPMDITSTCPACVKSWVQFLAPQDSPKHHQKGPWPQSWNRCPKNRKDFVT